MTNERRIGNLLIIYRCDEHSMIQAGQGGRGRRERGGAGSSPVTESTAAPGPPAVIPPNLMPGNQMHIRRESGPVFALSPSAAGAPPAGGWDFRRPFTLRDEHDILQRRSL
jgi:hypothetical protein